MALAAVILLGLGCATAVSTTVVAPPSRALALSPATARQVALRLHEATSAHGPFSLRLSEDELSSYLAYEAETAPLHDLRVWFSAGRVYVSGQAPELGGVRLLAVASLSLREGVPQATLHHLLLNGQPLPRLAVDALQQALNDGISDARLSVRLEEITIEEGVLFLRGAIAP